MSRYHCQIGERFRIAFGVDRICGQFIQFYDFELEGDPSGEGLVIDWDEYMGVTQDYTGHGLEKRPDRTQLIDAIYQYIKDEAPKLEIPELSMLIPKTLNHE